MISFSINEKFCIARILLKLFDPRIVWMLNNNTIFINDIVVLKLLCILWSQFEKDIHTNKLHQSCTSFHNFLKFSGWKLFLDLFRSRWSNIGTSLISFVTSNPVTSSVEYQKVHISCLCNFNILSSISFSIEKIEESAG